MTVGLPLVFRYSLVRRPPAQRSVKGRKCISYRTRSVVRRSMSPGIRIFRSVTARSDLRLHYLQLRSHMHSCRNTTSRQVPYIFPSKNNVVRKNRHPKRVARIKNPVSLLRQRLSRSCNGGGGSAFTARQAAPTLADSTVAYSGERLLLVPFLSRWADREYL
jgi:hypothetical protein